MGVVGQLVLAHSRHFKRRRRASRAATGERAEVAWICSAMFVRAPFEQPWKNDSLVNNYQATMISYGFKVVQDSVHPQ